jgi:hypothetical protein
MSALPTFEPNLFLRRLKDLPRIRDVLFLTPKLCSWVAGEALLKTDGTRLIATELLGGRGTWVLHVLYWEPYPYKAF